MLPFEAEMQGEETREARCVGGMSSSTLEWTHKLTGLSPVPQTRIFRIKPQEAWRNLRASLFPTMENPLSCGESQVKMQMFD